MMARRWRNVCEHVYMLCLSFFLLWNVFYMTEAQWTFDVRGAFPAVWLGLAAAALLMCRMRPGAAGWLLALPVWMAVASAYRGAEVLQAQLADIWRAVLAFGVVLMAPRVVRRERLLRYVKAVLLLWTVCLTLQALIGLWAALTGHAVFSLKGTWYIGVNLGDHRLYLNAYVITGAVKMGLSALLAVLLAAMCRRVAARVLCGACAALQLVCLALTDCRTAFIAVGFALGLMAAVWILQGVKARPALRWMAALAAVAAAVVLAYAGLSGLLTAASPLVPQELENLSLPELPAHLLPHAAAEGAVQHRALEAANLFNSRQIIWQAALRLLWREPRFLLTGTTTALAPALTDAQIPPDMYPGYAFQHVHNVYLQVLVSWGLPGLVLLGAFLVCFLRAAWRVMVRHDLPGWQRLLPVPVLYMMLCEMVDCFTRLSEDSPLLLFACLFAGMTLAADAAARRGAQQEVPPGCAVDVIVPAYNAEAYLPRAVASALQCPAARVILVDDGSTDGSGALCDELAADPRVKVLHQENRGAAAARNAGMAAATAAYVAFLDADDALLPGALGTLMQSIADADAAQGDIVRDAPVIYPELRVQELPGRDALGTALSDPTRHLLCHGWLFRRGLLREGFNEQLTLGEDGEWMLRTLRHAGKVRFVRLPAYRYTVRPDSALHGAAGAEAAYLRTLAAAAPVLEPLDMPQEAAIYRLTHLLLLLTHDPQASMEQLREASPFAEAFAAARLTGLSPRMVALRLLRDRRYGLVRMIIRLRRRMNRGAAKRTP